MSNLGGSTPFELYNSLKSQGILFCFVGPLSQGILEEVGVVLRARLESNEPDLTKVRKVFAVFVEQMQNIFSHSIEVLVEGTEEGVAEVRQGLLVMGKEKDNFFVLSGNYVDNEDVDDIRDQLLKLQHMGQEEMKVYFKEMRKKEREGVKKGAGIGFIETARKASEPLQFEISKVDDAKSFFCLKAVV